MPTTNLEGFEFVTKYRTTKESWFHKLIRTNSKTRPMIIMSGNFHISQTKTHTMSETVQEPKKRQRRPLTAAQVEEQFKNLPFEEKVDLLAAFDAHIKEEARIISDKLSSESEKALRAAGLQ